MAQITTRPATLAEWDDVQAALTGGGDGRSCQCEWPMMTNAEWSTTTVEERRDRLHAEVADGPPPGLVAYVDGEAAGWVRIGPRTAQRRLLRSRVVKSGSAQPLEDDSVWALSCFSVRKEHRGRGLNSALLEAAIDYARSSGARVVEAHPIDAAATKTSSNSLFVGALSTFLAAGFREVARPTGSRVVVELELTA